MPAEKLTVRELMTKNVITVDIKANVLEATRMMSEKNIGSLIITENGKPVGILTERDVIRKSCINDTKPSAVSVQDIMSSPLVSVEPATEIQDAVRRMRIRNVRRLAVFEEDKLAGIITDRDIINAYPKLLFVEAMKSFGGTYEQKGDKGVEALKGATKSLMRKRIDEAIDKAFIERILSAIEEPLEKKLNEIRNDIYTRYERALEDALQALPNEPRIPREIYHPRG